MYFEDEPRREDYPGDYSPEDDNLEDIDEEKVEGEIVVEDVPEETSEKLAEAEDELEDEIEISDEPEMRKIPEDGVADSEASEDSPEVMIRSPVLASKTESEPSGKSKFFNELGDFDEIKIGRLDGNSGNLATFIRWIDRVLCCTTFWETSFSSIETKLFDKNHSSVFKLF